MFYKKIADKRETLRETECRETDERPRGDDVTAYAIAHPRVSSVSSKSASLEHFSSMTSRLSSSFLHKFHRDYMEILPCVFLYNLSIISKYKIIVFRVNISFIYRRPTLYPLEIAVDFLKSL